MQPGWLLEPPPTERGDEPLYRVVYVIDINATDARQAAERADEIMRDPSSMPAVLEVLAGTPLNRSWRTWTSAGNSPANSPQRSSSYAGSSGTPTARRGTLMNPREEKRSHTTSAGWPYKPTA